MKRTAVILLTAALITSPVGGAAEAKKKKGKKTQKIERVASAAYDAPAPGVAGVLSGGNCGSPNTGCAQFMVGQGETFASFKIVDGSGQAATGAIATDDGSYQGYFCGATDAPFPVTAGATYTVWVHNGPSVENACPGVATSGTVEATFTNFE